MVIWITSALLAAGLTLAKHVCLETVRSETEIEDAKSYFLARGAIEQSALQMLWGQRRGGEEWHRVYQDNGSPSMDLIYPAGVVHVDVLPETSKLNLNASPPAEVSRLLTALGIPQDRAADLTAAITDWRQSVDPLHSSPFDSFYLSRSPAFSARHAPFQENDELLLVKGITAELYYGSSLDSKPTGLRDCLSVYGSVDAVDVNTAQKATLMAVGISATEAETIVRSRVTRPALDSKDLGQIAKALGPAGSHLRVGGLTMFTLRATARLRQPDGRLSDLRRTAAAFAKFYFPGEKGTTQPGFEILRWFDRG
jgi:general secretion pathway protein K